MTAIRDWFAAIIDFFVMTWKCTIDEFHDSTQDD
jgi:hypothetical protein